MFYFLSKRTRCTRPQHMRHCPISFCASQFCPTAPLHITGTSSAPSGTSSFGKNPRDSRNIQLERNSRSSPWKGKAAEYDRKRDSRAEKSTSDPYSAFRSDNECVSAGESHDLEPMMLTSYRMCNLDNHLVSRVLSFLLYKMGVITSTS